MSATTTTYTINETTRLSMVVFTNERGAIKSAVGIKRLVGNKWMLDHKTCDEFYHSKEDGTLTPRSASYYASDLLAKEFGGFDKTPCGFSAITSWEVSRRKAVFCYN